MLIKITRSCSMGCSHCMNNAIPCNQHMTIDTFKDTLSFIKKYDDGFLGDSLTGGEPFENTLIWDFVDLYFETMPSNRILTITTNGLYLQNNQLLIQDKLDEYPLLFFQVTNDIRYYPIKLDLTKRIFRHNRVVVIEELNHLSPKGRALINHPSEVGKLNKCPPCINVKLAAIQSGGRYLKDIIGIVRSGMNKNCIPSIQYDGSIAFGEFDDCPNYVSIYDDEATIVNEILNFKCGNCPELMDKFKKNVNSLLPQDFIREYGHYIF